MDNRTDVQVSSQVVSNDAQISVYVKGAKRIHAVMTFLQRVNREGMDNFIPTQQNDVVYL